jgi:hypothetical protein
MSVPIALLLFASIMASFARAAVPVGSPATCRANAASPRVVQVRLYSRSRFTDADLLPMLDVTNRVWQPYGVAVHPGIGPGTVIVVVSDGGFRAMSLEPTVLGTTLFVAGHAQGNIRLSLTAAEELSDSGDMNPPIRSRPSIDRDGILLRILGVALAHELGHYLLDTPRHSSQGLLQPVLSARDMQNVNLPHLGLTDEQRKLVCLSRP